MLKKGMFVVLSVSGLLLVGCGESEPKTPAVVVPKQDSTKIEDAAKKTGDAVKEGATKAGEAVKEGATKAGEAIKEGAEATKNAAEGAKDDAAKKLEDMGK